MRKCLLVCLLFLTLVFTMAASNYVPKVLTVHYDNAKTIYVGETFSLKSNSLYTYTSTNDNVAKYDEKEGVVVGSDKGYAVIQKINRSTKEVVREYTFLVKSEPKDISIVGTNYMCIGETYTFEAFINPSSADNDVIWSSNDESVLSIDESGNATAKKCGLVTITATSKTHNKVYGTQYVLVDKPAAVTYETENVNVDLNNIYEVVDIISKKTESSVLVVTGYKVSNDKKEEASVGCGIIYKRVAHLKDGTTVENGEINMKEVENIDYYVVTNRHVVASTVYNEKTATSKTTNYDYIGLYYGGNEEIGAKIIAYDAKVDLAVITFTSALYFPVATFGSSDDVQSGEFIVSVGTAEGKEYYTTTTFGIVSHPKRYISDDTDGDGTNDWDAEYIQHDAPINNADCGSPIVNMKGEIIGINTTKKIESTSGIKVENLSFAIPINLAKTIIEILEVGGTITRPILGVSIIDVRAILADEDAFRVPGYATDDGIVLPKDIDHGFYVAEVNKGGVAEAANILPGDIILNFNGVEVYYSYQLRAQLGNVIVGQGVETEIVVFRNGERVTLHCVF